MSYYVPRIIIDNDNRFGKYGGYDDLKIIEIINLGINMFYNCLFDLFCYPCGILYILITYKLLIQFCLLH